jgi:hypothetical protein
MSIIRKIENRIFKKYILRLRKQWTEDTIAQRTAYDKTLPKFDLETKHILNTQLLLDRAFLLENLPKNAVCAEIGVDKGDFTTEILNITSPKKIHLIDAWGDENRYHDGLMKLVKEKFKSEISENQLKLNVGLSTDILKTFPNEYFDWVYIDTAHTYEVTSEELKIIKDKMKKGGIIAGHDFIKGNWLAAFRYGVVEAVHEFCVRENWELLYLTCEVNQHRSFAIKAL